MANLGGAATSEEGWWITSRYMFTGITTPSPAFSKVVPSAVAELVVASGTWKRISLALPPPDDGCGLPDNAGRLVAGGVFSQEVLPRKVVNPGQLVEYGVL